MTCDRRLLSYYRDGQLSLEQRYEVECHLRRVPELHQRPAWPDAYGTGRSLDADGVGRSGARPERAAADR